MPSLMRAVDLLVENAGGLMAMEGMATGLPVATYRPIPGHGTRSAATLHQAGVSTWVRHPGQLRSTLVRLLDGDLGERERSAAAPMLRADPADIVARLAAPRVTPRASTPAAPRASSRSWSSRPVWRSTNGHKPTLAEGVAADGVAEGRRP
jgi:hypothetical protein